MTRRFRGRGSVLSRRFQGLHAPPLPSHADPSDPPPVAASLVSLDPHEPQSHPCYPDAMAERSMELVEWYERSLVADIVFDP